MMPVQILSDITYGAIVNLLVIVFAIGVVWGSLRAEMRRINARLHELKDVLTEIAKQKVEIEGLAGRLDDIQRYGSHRLAETLEAMRRQITSDFREKFEHLQRQLDQRRPHS
jgi:hypothetical protein